MMGTAMQHFAKEMAFYSAYHQERTNIWIHVFGVPLISFTAFALAACLPLATVQGFSLSLATLVWATSSLYYLRLDLTLGAVATVLYGLLCWAAHAVAAEGLGVALSVFAVGQVVGWTAQIYGHLHFERNRPAFFENLFQSFVSAPLFVIADVFFHFGWKQALQREVTEILADTGRLREFEAEGALSR